MKTFVFSPWTRATVVTLLLVNFSLPNSAKAKINQDQGDSRPSWCPPHGSPSSDTSSTVATALPWSWAYDPPTQITKAPLIVTPEPESKEPLNEPPPPKEAPPPKTPPPMEPAMLLLLILLPLLVVLPLMCCFCALFAVVLLPFLLFLLFIPLLIFLPLLFPFLLIPAAAVVVLGATTNEDADGERGAGGAAGVGVGVRQVRFWIRVFRAAAAGAAGPMRRFARRG